MKIFLISSLLSSYSREVLLLCHWTQGMRGGTIATEVLDTSDSLREFCSKCGHNLTCGGLPLITCTGNCQPQRTFHSKCVPKLRHADQDFKCLVCRLADREDFCVCCNGPATQCWGITRIHRSPSRPRPSMRPTAAFINIHEHLI